MSGKRKQVEIGLRCSVGQKYILRIPEIKKQTEKEKKRWGGGYSRVDPIQAMFEVKSSSAIFQPSIEILFSFHRAVNI